MLGDMDADQDEKRPIRTIGTFFFRLQSGGTERVVSYLAKIWTAAGYSPLLLWDLLLCRLNQVRFIIHCHNIFSQFALHNPVMYTNLPYAYTLADGIVTLSRMDAVFWRHFNKNVRETVNPSGYFSVEEVLQSLSEGKTVIFCQRFSAEKHPEDVIDIFSIVHRFVPEARLEILGKGEDDTYADRLKEMVRAQNLKDSVTFHGYQKNVEAFYQKADVCMITSEYEGFPLGMLESMSAGVPVVMYELPYLTLAEKGRGVISVKDQDKTEMAERIIELLNCPEKKKQLGREARAAAEEMIGFGQEKQWKRIFSEAEKSSGAVYDVPMMWDLLFDHLHRGMCAARDGLLSGHSGADSPGLSEALYQIAELRRSKSFRLGRALTFMPRLIRHLLTGYPM